MCNQLDGSSCCPMWKDLPRKFPSDTQWTDFDNFTSPDKPNSQRRKWIRGDHWEHNFRWLLTYPRVFDISYGPGGQRTGTWNLSYAALATPGSFTTSNDPWLSNEFSFQCLKASQYHYPMHLNFNHGRWIKMVLIRSRNPNYGTTWRYAWYRSHVTWIM